MTTPAISPQESVASVVLQHSECARVFQRHHIDFCCRGELSLASAAQERHVDLDELVRELSTAIAERRGPSGADPRALSTEHLVAHIVGTHHEPLRRALPFLRPLAAKVARVHGDHNPKLLALRVAVEDLADALLPHLDEEERVLFPALMAADAEPARVAPQLAEMMKEHLAVARVLEQIVDATEDFSLPDWACNSYRTLFRELQAVQGDLFTHIHLENHVLRPRFAAPTPKEA